MAMAQVWICWAGFWYHCLSTHVLMKQTFGKKTVCLGYIQVGDYTSQLFSDDNEP